MCVCVFPMSCLQLVFSTEYGQNLPPILHH
uniref:Uncharacterized protein n=1 Tax=Anguilla anguilla TaxID=7936 RepID=A0A0E9RAY4_ANGAN